MRRYQTSGDIMAAYVELFTLGASAGMTVAGGLWCAERWLKDYRRSKRREAIRSSLIAMRCRTSRRIP